MSADDAVKLIHPNDTVAISGFASAGTPKDSITALAHRIGEARDAGDDFTINLLTGASVSPQTERLLAEVDGIACACPTNPSPPRAAESTPAPWTTSTSTSPTSPSRSGRGTTAPSTSPSSRSPGCTADGELIPSTSVGNNKTWLDVAEKVILEVNSCVPAQMKGMHDIYYGTALPRTASRS